MIIPFLENNRFSDKSFLLLLLLFCLLLFIPFSGKHFAIDSPVTVHVAHQLAINPINPPLGEYGHLLAPWNHTELPQSSVFYITPHPPIIQLYLAPFIYLMGERELLLSWLIFPFYYVSALFFYGCAKTLSFPYKRWLSLIFCAAPVVAINAHDLMNDIPLLAFTLGTFFFMFKPASTGNAFAAGLCATLGMLTKFTAGTLLITALFYYLSKKRWKELIIFSLPFLILYGAWIAHNIILFGKVQLISNGHMRYLPGDIRYRFERLISYAGGTLIFPAIPVFLAFRNRSSRIIAAIFSILTLIWSVLLIKVLHYNWGSALFYALSSSAGLLLLFWSLRGLLQRIKKTEYSALFIHSILQLAGGLFLTLYASRYLTPLLITLFFGFALFLETIESSMFRGTIIKITLLSSIIITILLSVGDNLDASIPFKLSKDIQEKYAAKKINYAGRLGYLYYLNKNGMNYCFRGAMPAKGEYIIHPENAKDDTFLIAENLHRMIPVDTFSYPVFPFACIGGRAGFYGNDRLPWTLILKNRWQRYFLYEIIIDSRL
jgi:hypothetical protein